MAGTGDRYTKKGLCSFQYSGKGRAQWYLVKLKD